MAKIAAICISDVRGIQKHEIPEAFLKKDWGIEGDAHAGNWHRQVSSKNLVFNRVPVCSVMSEKPWNIKDSG